MLYISFRSFDKLPRTSFCNCCHNYRHLLFVKKCTYHNYFFNFCVYCADTLRNDFCKRHRCHLCFVVVKKCGFDQCEICKEYACRNCCIITDFFDMSRTCLVCTPHTKTELFYLIKNLKNKMKKM